MKSHFISASDGLTLHAVEYGDRILPNCPAVCLPGLARTAADFEKLALALSDAPESPRRVIAVDYRGRGLSAYDKDPSNYSYAVELSDLEAVLTALGVGPALFIGTSRGGILTMLMAALSPTRIPGAVLNDIGPVIEMDGLLRIKGYLGNLPQSTDFEEAAAVLRTLFEAQFPHFSHQDWIAAARLTWREQEGRLVLNYDPNLARTLEGIDPAHPLPTLWPQFEALAHAPVMVIRGMLSDILSAETVAEMARRRPDMEVVEVADEGHPPTIGRLDLVHRLLHFASRCDEATTRAA